MATCVTELRSFACIFSTGEDWGPPGVRGNELLQIIKTLFIYSMCIHQTQEAQRAHFHSAERMYIVEVLQCITSVITDPHVLSRTARQDGPGGV